MEKQIFTNRAIYKYTIGVLLLIFLLYGIESILYAKADVEQICKTTLQAAESQVEYRVYNAIQLLKSLAEERQYADPSISPMDKVDGLEQVNANMGYMMIRYVDEDINVYSQRGPTSLASREYMQKLFATGEVQVTDSFAAGSDGVTLNYTIAVPVYYNGQISGCIFCAIYFDEIQQLLTEAARQAGIEVTLLGSKVQMMSATDTVHYGDSYMEYIRNAYVMGNTKDQLEEDLLGNGKGEFWMIQNMNLTYATYVPIENTSWSVVATISFWYTFGRKMIESLPMVLVALVLTMFLAWVSGSYLPAQKARVQSLVDLVGDLEQKLSLQAKSDVEDFDQVIQLTSEGLSDNLTGVGTRSVFYNQIQGYLDELPDNKLAVLCFIDLDDLKLLNDEYGHVAGDTALKEIGFVLREYEKKFDGLVGRYGGDEFVALLTGLRDKDELHQLMEELTDRLTFSMPEFGPEVVAQCSIGATLLDKTIPFDMLLNQADQALYAVKQKGKGTYEIYKGGESR